MVFISDTVLDAACNVLVNNADRVDICSQEPANLTEATSTYTVGNKTSGISFGSPANGDTSGRKTTLGAITGGTVTDDAATAAYWAASDAGTELLVTQSISSPQTVYTANPWSLGAIDVEFPDPS